MGLMFFHKGMDVYIGGCKIKKISKQELISEIKKWIEEDSKGRYIIPMNLSKLTLMQKDKKLAECIRNSACNIADGFSLILASRIIGNKIPERITGIELTEELIKLSVRCNFKLYFLGSKPEVIKLCVEKIEQKYPNISLVGYHDGYFKDYDLVVKDISDKAPNILFVGLGMPQKEYFIYDFYRKLNANIIIAVGGAFDVIAGFKKRAPLIIQRIGLEWLWRSIYDHTRMVLIIKNIWIFLGILIKDIWNQRIIRRQKQ